MPGRPVPSSFFQVEGRNHRFASPVHHSSATALAGQGGDLVGQVGVIVLKDGAGALPLHLQAGDGGVVAVAQTVHLAGSQPPQGRLEAADGGAVGEQGDRLGRVGRRQAEHRALEPRLYLGEGLSPLHPEVRGAVIEADQIHGVAPLQLAPGLVLPCAQADLPQARVGVQLQTVGQVDRFGGSHCTEQVAGVHRVDMYVRKPSPQGRDLPVAVFGDQAVVPAVYPAVEIPLRLRVADQIDGCHRFTAPLNLKSIVLMPPESFPAWRQYASPRRTHLPRRPAHWRR